MGKTDNIRYLRDINHGVEVVICNNSTISYPIHNHVSVFTIGMVLEGTIVLNIHHEELIYNKGQIFSIFPYVPHSIHANKSYSLISICINKDTWRSAQGKLDKFKKDMMNLLQEELIGFEINKNQINHLINGVDCFNVENLYENKTRSIMMDLKQQLELFPENQISIEEMAQAAFLSKYHFIRSFKEEIGLTPHQFQLQNRIRKGKQIINSVDTIAEVAMNTGFCDESHFIKQFEKRVGLTPTSYKMSCDVFKSNYKV